MVGNKVTGFGVKGLLGDSGLTFARNRGNRDQFNDDPPIFPYVGDAQECLVCHPWGVPGIALRVRGKCWAHPINAVFCSCLQMKQVGCRHLLNGE